MSGVFPDSGVPPTDANNSIPDPDTVNCTGELWYSTSRCQPRFDPAAANAVTAEIINLVNCAGLPYDCSKLDNLCEAVEKLIADAFTQCLKFQFPLISGQPCSIEYLVHTTDAAGCRKIVRYDPALLPTIASVRNNSVYGNSYPRASRPTDPTNPATYYDQVELGADQTAGTIDESRLGANRLARATFTLPCTSRISIKYGGVVEFQPAANGGNGRVGSLCARIDGKFILSSTGAASAFDTFTNFDRSQEGEQIATLAAGSHTVEVFVTAGGTTQPAQVGIIGHPTQTGGYLIIKPAVG